MHIQRIAAFSNNGIGGNPAGVVLLDVALPEKDMRRIATEVGYSETVFAVRTGDGDKSWRARYFSPESEVPFCGHATIALGSALGQSYGPGTYDLTLNDVEITVDAIASGDGMGATLASPPTKSRPATDDELHDTLKLFGLGPDDLDNRLPPARIHAGADHIMLALRNRDQLAAMRYDLDQGRHMMRQHALVTVMLVYIDGDQRFHVRNAFASGGVVEDPATGAAAAAFAGYLRDRDWPHGGQIMIRQGDDMGAPSLIKAAFSDQAGSAIRVTGTTRAITDE